MSERLAAAGLSAVAARCPLDAAIGYRLSAIGLFWMSLWARVGRLRP